MYTLLEAVSGVHDARVHDARVHDARVCDVYLFY
jgi:hypothetical protein